MWWNLVGLVFGSVEFEVCVFVLFGGLSEVCLCCWKLLCCFWCWGCGWRVEGFYGVVSVGCCW